MKIVEAEFIKSCAREEDFPAEGIPEIAVVGRSNVGKSSLINQLVRRKGLAKTSGTPGKTRLINFFKILIGGSSGGVFHLVDLPGYGYARVSKMERAEWGSLVEKYITGRAALKAVIVLMDIRRPPGPLDRQLMAWLESHQIPGIVVTTKSDQVSRSARGGALRAIQASLPAGFNPGELLSFSAKTGEGREDLLHRMDEILKGGTLPTAVF